MRLIIRSQGFDLSQGLPAAIERRLRFLLGRFGTRVNLVTIDLAELSRQKVDIERRCRIVARLLPKGQVCVDVADRDVDTALDRAAERIGPAITREFLRRCDEGKYPAG